MGKDFWMMEMKSFCAVSYAGKKTVQCLKFPRLMEHKRDLCRDFRKDQEMTWHTQETALMLTCIGCRQESVGIEQ